MIDLKIMAQIVMVQKVTQKRTHLSDSIRSRCTFCKRVFKKQQIYFVFDEKVLRIYPPESRKDSSRRPPGILMIWMASRLPEPFSLRTASTASFAKKSLCCERILEEIVVLAMFIRSSLNLTSSSTWLREEFSSAWSATFEAWRQPAMMVWEQKKS